VLGPETTIEYLREGPRPVSFHWIVLPSGKIVPLVDEEMAAFHIGGSPKEGWTNNTTIGVAVAGESPLSRPEQTAALYRLLADISKRRNIAVDAILSHGEVDPRKMDIPEQQMNEIRENVSKFQKRESKSAKD
jgi:N-acetyl-anhydromuramyl-L-alanine amidase AmpD